MTGCVIAFEGIDGSGKTLVSSRVGVALRGLRYDVDRIHGPFYLTQIYDILRGRRPDPGWRGMATLFTADRWLQKADEDEAREEGRVLLVDRHIASTFAYQGALAVYNGSRDSFRAMQWIEETNRFSSRPDLTIILSVSMEKAFDRRMKRGDTPEIYEQTEFLSVVSHVYESLVDRPGAPDIGRAVIVDANRETEDVIRDCLDVIERSGVLSECSRG